MGPSDALPDSKSVTLSKRHLFKKKNVANYCGTLLWNLSSSMSGTVNWSAKKGACDKDSEVVTKRCFLLRYSTHIQDNISIDKIQNLTYSPIFWVIIVYSLHHKITPWGCCCCFICLFVWLCVWERVFFWECTCFVKYNSSWVTNIFTCRQYLRYELFLYWPIEIIVKDKVLTQWLKKLQFIFTRKRYQKRNEGKEDKGININYATMCGLLDTKIVYRTNWVRSRLLPIEWMLQLLNLVGRVGVLQLIEGHRQCNFLLMTKLFGFFWIFFRD